jgi:RNA polymerase sigma-70 factor (ECF subfamily)
MAPDGSEDHRAIVVLRDLEHQSYESISALLELPMNTVRSRLHRARLQLREYLR